MIGIILVFLSVGYGIPYNPDLNRFIDGRFEQIGKNSFVTVFQDNSMANSKPEARRYFVANSNTQGEARALHGCVTDARQWGVNEAPILPKCSRSTLKKCF